MKCPTAGVRFSPAVDSSRTCGPFWALAMLLALVTRQRMVGSDAGCRAGHAGLARDGHPGGSGGMTAGVRHWGRS